MRCPYCGYEESKVVDTRPSEEGESIRRRRECFACKARFTTYERVERRPMMVVKKDGTREAFDRSKVLAGMLISSEKRAISVECLEEAAAGIERSLLMDFDQEVPSQEIGERVMQALMEIDEVAYVRFAAVYRRFADIESFQEALDSMKKRKRGK